MVSYLYVLLFHFHLNCKIKLAFELKSVGRVLVPLQSGGPGLLQPQSEIKKIQTHCGVGMKTTTNPLTTIAPSGGGTESCGMTVDGTRNAACQSDDKQKFAERF